MIGVAVRVLYDKSREAEARYDRAAKAGVTASAQVLLNALKRAYNKYYTSRAFRSTLQIRQSLRRSNPEKAKDGWYTLVGVPRATVSTENGPVDRGMVALYWELGHTNHWIRKNGKPTEQRVQIAVPAAIASLQAMSDAWARTVKRYMEAP
ncbi:MAG: hypothetical protein ACO3GP_05815 [Candidatus Limnocylindrus sp.]